jgi:hypothetical protein
MKNDVLHIMGQDNKLRQCLSTTKVQKVIRELHDGIVKGHFTIEITHKKILDVRYFWPTMYKDVNEFCRSCNACQHTRGLAT